MEKVLAVNNIDVITKLVYEEISKLGITIEEDNSTIPVSVSARHIHVSQEDLEILFGKGYKLTKFKDISQPGQYASEEKVTIVGPRGSIKNLRILGPVRNETQVELSVTDTRTIGINPVMRQSGKLEGTPGIKIIGTKGEIIKDKGCIVAERHIHMTKEDSKKYGVHDGEIVKVKINSIRGGILDNVFVRVRDDFALDMHIDVDDANAMGIKTGDRLEIMK